MAWTFGKRVSQAQKPELDERVQVPQEILDRIGYEAWEPLSWALQNQWVQEYKWLMSKSSGRDIGVPDTVTAMMMLGRGMLEKDYFLTSGPSDETGFRGLIKFESIKPIYTGGVVQLMILGYLLGTDFVSPMKVKRFRPDGSHEIVQTGIVPDEHGANQLEGELRRQWARVEGIRQPEAISGIPITHRLLEDYCRTYVLDNNAKFSLGQKLFL